MCMVIFPIQIILRLSEVRTGTRGRNMNWYQIYIYIHRYNNDLKGTHPLTFCCLKPAKEIRPFALFHKLRYIGEGISNTNFGSFLRVISWYIHIVPTFLVYLSKFTSYILFSPPFSSDFSSEYYYCLDVLAQKLPVPCSTNTNVEIHHFPSTTAPHQEMVLLTIWNLTT